MTETVPVAHQERIRDVHGTSFWQTDGADPSYKAFAPEDNLSPRYAYTSRDALQSTRWNTSKMLSSTPATDHPERNLDS